MSNAKEFILGRLRDSVAFNSHIPEHKPSYGDGAIHIESDLLTTYKTNQTNNKSIVLETTKEELEKTINGVLQEIGAKDVLYNLDIDADVAKLQGCTFTPYDKSVDEIRHHLFQIDTSIVQARCGVADLGIMGLSSNVNAPRLSSLITNTCIYLLDKRNIVRNLFNGVEFIKNFEKTRSGTDVLPSNIIFVAGPSRTADIELITVFGVHGPRATYTILY